MAGGSPTHPGKYVRAAREALGLSQDRLAELSGIARPRISILENERNDGTGSDLRDGLATGFGVSLDDLAALLKGTVAVEDFVRRAKPPAKARVVDRELPSYSEAEEVFADALAAGEDEKIIAAARVRLGKHRGKVTREMAIQALKDAKVGAARMKKELGIRDQESRVDALRKR